MNAVVPCILAGATLALVAVGCGKSHAPDDADRSAQATDQHGKTDRGSRRSEQGSGAQTDAGVAEEGIQNGAQPGTSGASPERSPILSASSDAQAEQPEERLESPLDTEELLPSARVTKPNAQQRSSKQIAKKPATFTALSKLIEATNAAPTGKDALELIDKFVADYETDQAQRKLVDDLRNNYAPAVPSGAAPPDVSKHSPDEPTQSPETPATDVPGNMGNPTSPLEAPVDTGAKVTESNVVEAANLTARAIELIRASSFKDAVPMLEKATRLDSNGVCAPFVRGMLNTHVGSNNASAAKRHFRTALSRAPKHVAVLNNLAITEVKLRDFDSALNHWRSAVEVAPKTQEVAQNLGRFIDAVAARKIAPSARVAKAIATLYAKVTGAGKGAVADPGAGWLYYPVTLSRDETAQFPESLKGSRLVAFGSGTGFVVAPHTVLTSRHVVEQDGIGVLDVVRVLDPSDPQHVRELDATIVALAQNSDLAILDCPKLDAAPIPLAQDVPGLRTPIMVLGFPTGDEFGRTVGTTQGAVSALPTSSNEGLLVYDATTDSGNIGGPVCDLRRRVVAVHAKANGFQRKMAGGVLAATATAFLQSIVPEFAPATAERTGELDWPAVSRIAGPSTVMIVNYGRTIELGFKLEDVTCIACNGSGRVPCTRKGCVKGKISVRRTEIIGMHPRTRRPVTQVRTYQVDCTACKGGQVDCPYCVAGMERRM